MVLNNAGKIANDEWLNTPKIRTNVELGEFIIMPNHMHGIIQILERGELHSYEKDSNNKGDGELHSHKIVNVHKGECNSPPQGPSNTIGTIIRGYKSSVTKQLNLMNIGCAVWQRNYHEHIIRNEQSYQNISNYIIHNRTKWMEKFEP